MTDPNDDVGVVADPGGVDPARSGDSAGRSAGDFEYDEVHRDDDDPGVPGSVPDSPAAQGSPVGPPD
jgi:hypothetical protein